MATISSIGVGSGLDVNSIINALLSVQRQPIDLLATEAKSIDAKLSSFGKVQSYLDSMRTDRSALPGHLVRFSIGLESVADLQADLAQALKTLE